MSRFILASPIHAGYLARRFDDAAARPLAGHAASGSELCVTLDPARALRFDSAEHARSFAADHPRTLGSHVWVSVALEGLAGALEGAALARLEYAAATVLDAWIEEAPAGFADPLEALAGALDSLRAARLLGDAASAAGVPR